MDILLLVIFLTIIGKIMLKVFFPKLNSKINKPFRDIKTGIEGYYEYCKQFWWG